MLPQAWPFVASSHQALGPLPPSQDLEKRNRIIQELQRIRDYGVQAPGFDMIWSFPEIGLAPHLDVFFTKTIHFIHFEVPP